MEFLYGIIAVIGVYLFGISKGKKKKTEEYVTGTVENIKKSVIVKKTNKNKITEGKKQNVESVNDDGDVTNINELYAGDYRD